MRQILENETPYGTIRNQINSNFEELYSEKGILIFDFLKRSSTAIGDDTYNEIMEAIEAQIPIYVHIADDTHSQYIFPVLKVAKNVLDDRGEQVYALTYNTFIDSGVDVYSEMITLGVNSPHKQSYMKRALGLDEKQDKIKIFEFNNRDGYTFAMSNDEYAELLQYVNTGKLAFIKLTDRTRADYIYPILECGKDMLDTNIVIKYNTVVDANKEVYSEQIKVATADSAHIVSYDNVALGFANKQDKESSELLTTNKTIVGAINEVNSKVGAEDICILDVDTYDHDTDFNRIYNAVKNNKVIIIAGNEHSWGNKNYFTASVKLYTAKDDETKNDFTLKFAYDFVTYTVYDSVTNTDGLKLSKFINTFFVDLNNKQKIKIKNDIHIYKLRDTDYYEAVNFNTLLNQVKNYDRAKFTIVNVKDDGGSSSSSDRINHEIENIVTCKYVKNKASETDDFLDLTWYLYVVDKDSEYSFYGHFITLISARFDSNGNYVSDSEYSCETNIGSKLIIVEVDNNNMDNRSYNLLKDDIYLPIVIRSGNKLIQPMCVDKKYLNSENGYITVVYIDDSFKVIKLTVQATENSDGTHNVTKETKKLAFDTST